MSGVVGPALVVVALAAQGLFALSLRQRVQRALAGLERQAGMVARLSNIVVAIEGAPFEDPTLRHLQADLDAGGVPPSGLLAQLARLLSRLDDRRNLFFGIIAPFLLWTTRTALCRSILWPTEINSGFVRNFVRTIWPITSSLSISGFKAPCFFPGSL